MVLRDLEAIEVIVSDNGGPRLSDRAAQAQSNAAAIRSCLFAAVDEKDLWHAGDDGTLPLEGGRDLVRALAWFSSLDVTHGPYAYKGEIDARQQRELGVEVIATEERWLPFGRWGAYLGLIRFDPGGGLTPDPTFALADSLSQSPSGTTWDTEEFLKLVATVLPVLDGGVFAVSADQQRVARIPREADLSSALAFALLTLQERGWLTVEVSTGDSRKGRLPHGLGACSGVTWNGP